MRTPLPRQESLTGCLDMQELNSWVEENIPTVNKFFADFIVRNPFPGLVPRGTFIHSAAQDLESKPPATQPVFDPNTSLECQEIYRFILAHLDSIGKGLVSSNQEVRQTLSSYSSYFLILTLHNSVDGGRPGRSACADLGAHVRGRGTPRLGVPATCTGCVARTSLHRHRCCLTQRSQGSAGRITALDRASVSSSLPASSPRSSSSGSTLARESMLGVARTPPPPPPHGEQRTALTSSLPNQLLRTSPPRNPSPRPLRTALLSLHHLYVVYELTFGTFIAAPSPFAKPTAPPASDQRGFVRPVSPLPSPRAQQRQQSPSPSPPSPEAPTTAAMSLSTLLPSPAAPPSTPGTSYSYSGFLVVLTDAQTQVPFRREVRWHQTLRPAGRAPSFGVRRHRRRVLCHHHGASVLGPGQRRPIGSPRRKDGRQPQGDFQGGVSTNCYCVHTTLMTYLITQDNKNRLSCSLRFCRRSVDVFLESLNRP